MLVTSLSILAWNHQNLWPITLLIFQRYFKTLLSLLCLTESKPRRWDPRVLPGNSWKGRHGWHSHTFAAWACSCHLASLAQWQPNAPVYWWRSHKTFRSNYASYVPSFFYFIQQIILKSKLKAFIILFMLTFSLEYLFHPSNFCQNACPQCLSLKKNITQVASKRDMQNWVKLTCVDSETHCFDIELVRRMLLEKGVTITSMYIKQVLDATSGVPTQVCSSLYLPVIMLNFFWLKKIECLFWIFKSPVQIQVQFLWADCYGFLARIWAWHLESSLCSFIAVCNNVGDAAFLGQNQNLRILECPSHEPHISGISFPTGRILGDSELYYVGLHEYVYILRNKDIFLR